MDMREGEGPNQVPPTLMTHKRKVRPKKMEFIGWGSKLLIEFLQSIGKDTNQRLSQYEVAAVIKKYVQEHNLIHPEKKKKVVCDERLCSLFGKKSVPRNRIYDLLEEHYTENQATSEDDSYDSEEYEKDNKQQSFIPKTNTSHKQMRESETPKGCYAAIVPENIKLLYLNRTVVQDLLKNPESFERKLIGSYIRVKCVPYDCFRKNTHQLHPVSGVKNIHENGDVGNKVLLEVPNMIDAIPIKMLSDVNFSKEECEDLRQRVEEGLLKRPTLGEVEEKAQMLHEDIMKHWLPRELDLLQNLIDRANEKGWRKELCEYLERRELLKKPEEQSRLLLEVPKVIADDVEKEGALQKQDPEQDVKPCSASAPGSSRELSTPSRAAMEESDGGPTKGIVWIKMGNENDDGDDEDEDDHEILSKRSV